MGYPCHALGPPGKKTRDKPVQVDHLQHHLQLFHCRYHQLFSHPAKGMARSIKVLIEIVVLLYDGLYLASQFETLDKLYQEWHKVEGLFQA